MFVVGQRYLSEMEPNLGLGIVESVEERSVTINFPSSEDKRIYALRNAPLVRVTFTVSDRVEHQNGSHIFVTKFQDNSGVFTYFDDKGNSICEVEISDKISISSPVDKLLSGIIDDNAAFNLRSKVLEVNEYINSSPVRGFSGAKIELLGHQISVASEVTSRLNARVLLSDETGLGKTIEASLIIHRLLLTDRISRVLIVLPEPLVNQWFIELLRKFNLLFTIVNEESLKELENPYIENQLIISSIDLLKLSNIGELALKDPFDLVVFDEAHHLTVGSEEYSFAQKICDSAKSVILLTATPEQLGHESHFARLQLLDPEKYFSYSDFEVQQTSFEEIIKYINPIIENSGELTDGEIKVLHDHFPDISLSDKRRDRVIDNLIDRHGTGRNLFRNRRAVMEGFPNREVHLYELEDSSDDALLSWLKEYLICDKKRKSLLICGSLEKAETITAYLKKFLDSKVTTFTENMTIIQRDSAAANFSNSDGAQIMVCSEIGSEGRNFQFVNNLILLDLPIEAELLEQRIGRVDRIGQSEQIIIHVPFISGSRDHRLAQWYNSGLSIFERSITGIYEIVTPLKDELIELLDNEDSAKFSDLVRRCAIRKDEVEKRVEAGRDRILELNSYKKEKSKEIIEEINEYIESDDIQQLFLNILEFFGIECVEVEYKTYKLDFTMMNCKDFPMPPMKYDDFFITFSRATALKREDFEFITGDHPMVTSLIDIFLGEAHGSSSAGIIESKLGKKGVLFEAIFIAEVLSSKNLFINRFFPQEPIRVVIDEKLEDVTRKLSKALLKKELHDRIPDELLSNKIVKTELIPNMAKKAEEIATEKLNEIIDYSMEDMEDFQHEAVSRLEYLQTINSAIGDEDIKVVNDETVKLREAINSARLRLDSIRFIGIVDYIENDDEEDEDIYR